MGGLIGPPQQRRTALFTRCVSDPGMWGVPHLHPLHPHRLPPVFVWQPHQPTVGPGVVGSRVERARIHGVSVRRWQPNHHHKWCTGEGFVIGCVLPATVLAADDVLSQGLTLRKGQLWDVIRAQPLAPQSRVLVGYR
jgi:hypothetical protein